MSRPVKICTLCLEKPKGLLPYCKHLENAMLMVDQALEEEPDLIVLPEDYPTFESSPEETGEAAERFAEINALVGEKARRGHCYIVNPILEKGEGGHNFNTVFLLDRDGEVCLRYRKTHLAAFEAYHYGAVPGNELYVADTDFGKLGIMLCMDLHFPEVAGVLAAKGAEIVCLPTQSFGPSQDLLMTLLRSRAFDNQFYLVSSNFAEEPYAPGKHIGRSCVVGPDGHILADTGNHSGIATITIDLDRKNLLDWGYTECAGELTELYPDWRILLRSFRRPDIYGDLTKKEE